jgi:hypothetical protein
MRSRLPTFAVGSNLKPVLAWAGGAVLSDGVHCQLQVSKYDGTQWVQTVPVSDDVNSAVYGAAFALSVDDQALLAWRPPAAPDPGEIDLAALSGTTWQAFPPILPPAGVFFPVVYPVMRVRPDGSPVVLWGAGSGADKYFMTRGGPNGWTGDLGAIPIISQQPFDGPHFDMILDEDGNPIIGWVAPVDRGHVSRWDGTAWITAAERTEMDEPSLALDSARRPMVVTGGSGSFFVQSLANDDSWRLLPMAAAVPPQSRHARIAAGPDGLPVLAWFDAQTKGVGMARWLGQRWDTRAVFFSPSNALDEAPQLIVDRLGTAWIGWRDNTDQFNVWMSNF